MATDGGSVMDVYIGRVWGERMMRNGIREVDDWTEMRRG